MEAEEEQDPGDMRSMKKLVNPKMPSKEEVELHNMTHLPFWELVSSLCPRSWS